MVADDAMRQKDSGWRRYWIATLFAVLLCIDVIAPHWAAISYPNSDALTVIEWTINVASWTLSSLLAGIVCFFSAKQMAEGEQRTWQMIGFGCICWCIARLIWDYHDGIYHYSHVGVLLTTPHWTQVLYVQYPIWITVGLLSLPKSGTSNHLSVRQLANLALLVCTLAVVIVFTIFEPAAQTARGSGLVVALLLHGVWYPIAALITLHMLWGYRWQHAHWPLVLLLIAMTFHVIAFFTGAQRFIAGITAPAGWIRLTSSLSFTFVACAAHEHAWSLRHIPRHAASHLIARERWLDAVMPAFLFAAMTAAAAVNVHWITPRSMTLIAIIGFAFCIVLALRELWVQREEFRLVRELNESRDDLLVANTELLRSDQQVRALNAELEQRVAERTQALEAAYRELESFSYAVAHDIKAPLRTINAFGALLVDEFDATLHPKAQDYVRRMRDSTLHTAKLVDDLLAYAHIERAELRTRPTSLREVVERSVAEQADEIERIHAAVEVGVPDVSVNADSSALAQAIRNLLQNALKFSRNSQPPRIDISATRLNEHVRLTVADNGIGFDMQHVERIFALFQRLHRADQYTGTGIGLAIARKAVERMGGKLWAESTPGEGARFHLELPLNEAAAGSPHLER